MFCKDPSVLDYFIRSYLWSVPNKSDHMVAMTALAARSNYGLAAIGGQGWGQELEGHEAPVLHLEDCTALMLAQLVSLATGIE